MEEPAFSCKQKQQQQEQQQERARSCKKSGTDKADDVFQADVYHKFLVKGMCNEQ